ncbi:MAG TPA: hypothetical protein VK422_01790 [Pyrinomonadaceae bacterium]|nr:hypothetical protein [Pyrinomonadaceae bacterium]
MREPDEIIGPLVRELPEPEGARLFYERLTTEHPRAARAFERDAGLLADALALAAWSPLLAATLEQNPEYLAWLTRERAHPRLREPEELAESLARFAHTHMEVGPQAHLARFRRRELLRVYLRDIRRSATLVELTEELSNLADAALRHALAVSQQELENLYGAPQAADPRGRKTTASITVVALGKLGSRELNYSSDIDLLFIYSDDGETTGKGERGAVTNREFFCKLAERVSKTVGGQTGEGAAYRVDLRLRPHGRDGALAVSLEEALRYYREAAHAWELQALIRSRASAGSAPLFARFAEAVRGRVYRPEETVARALEHVRLAKQKIDRFHAESPRGFNVKLGRGGIREIEFIAQALQLAYGGRDAWLHAPHTLISLGRLADRGLLTERERSELSDAYDFLRTLEHRLQMEHGLQTHAVPEDPDRRALVARRMHFQGASALELFERALRLHTENVSRAYRRVFGADEAAGEPAEEVRTADLSSSTAAEPVRIDDAASSAAHVFARHTEGGEPSGEGADVLAEALREASARSLNPKRALTLLARVAASLDKHEDRCVVPESALQDLALLCGASEFFGEMIASNPTLACSVSTPADRVRGRDHRSLMRAAVDAEHGLGAELSALRRAWAHLFVELGAADVLGRIDAAEANALQTSLAAASVNVALLVARRELARRYGRLASGPRLAVLGLGRLGSGGVDYGSDLDLVLVYDPRVPSPVAGLTQDEAYARLVELLVVSLSSLTRDGLLYRVDLRLRPDGRNGPPASASHAFVQYLRERADVWEWLAYVKLRAVAGDMELGRAVERLSREAVHEGAAHAGADRLRAETRRVRERLERERATPARARDIKYGPGGMLDVYFAARYLQLRDRLPDAGDDRSTAATLLRLREAGSLAEEDFHALGEGYRLLRRLDHHLRLLVGRSTRLPSSPDHPVLADLARLAGYDTTSALTADLAARTAAVRAAYERITGS